MSTAKVSYGNATSMTITLASLAQGAAREATAVDNSSDLFLDAMVYLAIKLQTGTPASDRQINVYFYGSHDGTNFTDNVTGTNAAVTLRAPTNLRGPHTIFTPDAGALTYKIVIGSVASYFGGFLPKKWGIVVENRTNITLSATEGDHIKEYVGLYETVT